MKKTLIRFGRVLLACLISGAQVKYADNPTWQLLAVPAAAAAAKKLREKDPEKWAWLPL